MILLFAFAGLLVVIMGWEILMYMLMDNMDYPEMICIVNGLILTLIIARYIFQH